jgi:hypothetical protein
MHVRERDSYETSKRQEVRGENTTLTEQITESVDRTGGEEIHCVPGFTNLPHCLNSSHRGPQTHEAAQDGVVEAMEVGSWAVVLVGDPGVSLARSPCQNRSRILQTHLLR